MAKRMVSIRVEAEVLQVLRAAAKKARIPLTAFIVRAATKEAQHAAKIRGEEPALPAASYAPIGPPKAYRLAALEARGPGGPGYRRLGKMFMQVTSFTAHELTEFEHVLDDDRAAFMFLRRIRPEHLILAPPRQKVRFMEGVRQFIEENGMPEPDGA